MNKELINGVLDAVVDFVSACANDVCENESEEYVIFAGSVTSDSKGNLKTYSTSGDLVTQVPVRKILSNLKTLGHNVVDLIDADEAERKVEREADEAAEAADAEAHNKEIEDKINDLQSEISSLKLRKKHVVRHYVKRF